MTTFLRQRRSTLRMSQAELAEHLSVSQQTVARWETSGQIPAKYIKDLAILLGARVQDLLPRLMEGPSKQGFSDVRGARTAETSHDNLEEESEAPFGDVCFRFAGDPKGEDTYFPVTWGTLNRIQRQLGDAGISLEQTSTWVQFETLNNKWVTVNTQQVDRVTFMDSNVESMTGFAHPEVYKAALDLFGSLPAEQNMEDENFPYSKQLVEQARELIEAAGDRALTELKGFTVQFASGHQLSNFLNSEISTALDYVFGDEGEFEPQAPWFLQLTSRDNGQFEHVRLDGVRFIEAALITFRATCEQDET